MAATPAAQTLRLNAVTNVTENFKIGCGTAATDYTLTFDGETNDGVLTWMEDEDYLKFDDDIHFGDDTNYANFSDTLGQITWAGTYLKKLTLRPVLIQTAAKLAGEPTQVYSGCNVGYSLYKWAASPTAASQQELYWRLIIPARYNGVTDPQFRMCVTLAAGEDVGDKFKFQLEWQTTNKGNVIGTTTSTCFSEQTILTGRNDAGDTYFVFFTLDQNDATNPITAGEMLQARVRLVAASSSEVSGEIVIWDWSSVWAVDKVYGAWSVETNDV